jgi:predicted ATPase
VAEAVGLKLRGLTPALETLAAHLQGLRCFLLLDNCETLLDPVASMVDLLLGAVPGLRVLATSREALSLPGETVLAVGPMDLPTLGAGAEDVRQADAVRLFVQAASTARPGWTLAEADVAVVADICRRLDGIPLALSFGRPVARHHDEATGRVVVGAISCAGRRRRPARHDTLARSVQWSYDRLEPAEQRLLACIGVRRRL